MSWILGEALRNLVAGTTKALRNACVLAGVLTLLTAADVLTVDALVVRAQDYQRSGASITTLEAPGLIDGASCDSLAAAPGVRAAGAIQLADDSITAAALPGGAIVSIRISPGALRVFRVEGDTGGAGAILASDVMTMLGLHVGSSLHTLTAEVPIRGSFVWPQDGRRDGFGYAALVPDTSGAPFDECWVEAWPVPPNLSEVMRTALNPDPSHQTKIVSSQVNTSLGRTFNGGESYSARTTKFAPYVALFIGAGLGYVSVRARRLELAAAQHVGVTRPAQTLQLLFETGIWVSCAGIITGGIVSAGIMVIAETHSPTLWMLALYTAIPGMAGCLLGAVGASLSITEKQLFHYFKTR
ncbi:hypothetical protein [Leucobacter aridicollis]|uniref:FtsX-like permease family protein n=1 Tax=Leucobacter aridicollis TaxID=283878 RepID=A0A852R2D4_9MICO|nr:hypothetical protein [Leucobacter aridicollis]MBL3682153.1 hypothetical protein [Leucobacter aridicollis]NYD26797.1 hypothetical protein [Leucobacter aridicollis]